MSRLSRFSIQLLAVSGVSLLVLSSASGQLLNFKRADSNASGGLDLSDAVHTLGFLFLGTDAPPCEDAADSNDSGGLDLSDAVYTLGFLFLGTQQPPEPFAACALDPTEDPLDCASFDPCLQEIQTIVQEGVLVLDPQITTVMDVTNETLTVSGSSPALQAGQVLVSAQGQGLVRRIESVEQSGQDLVVHTSAATLEDVFEQANIAVQRTLTYDDWGSFEPMVEGVSFTHGEPPGDGAGAGLKLLDGNLKIRLPEFSPFPGVIVCVSGNVFFTVDLGINLTISRSFRLERFLFEPSFTLRTELEVDTFGEAQFLDAKFLLGRLTGHPIVVQAGPIPVVFTPTIDCYLKLKGTLQLGFEFNPSASLRAGAGLEYTRSDGWNAYPIAQTSFDSGLVPNVYVAYEGELSAFSPQMTLLTYGLIGPYVSLDAPYFKLRAERQLNPSPGQWEFTLDAGVRGSIGAKVDVLGRTLLDYDSPALVDVSTNLVTKIYPLDEVQRAWVARHNGANSASPRTQVVAVDSTGNVYATGISSEETNNGDYAIIKYSPEGAQLWAKHYNGSGNGTDFPTALALDELGNVYVTGRAWGDGYYYCATIKYASDGTPSSTWPDLGDGVGVRRYSGPGSSYNTAKDIAVDRNGNVHVTGESHHFQTPYYLTLKYSPDGQQLWVIRNVEGKPTAMALDGSGSVYVTGTSSGNYTTLKIASDGQEIIWLARYGGGIATALAIDNACNVYVTGSAVGDNWDYATVKYGPDGEPSPTWPDVGQGVGVRRYAGGRLGSSDFAQAVAVDSEGNAYITGWSEYPGTFEDYATIKYSPGGQQLWLARYNGRSNANDYATAITLDGTGNAYVTGRSASDTFDYATIKYSPHGQQRWVARYNGPGAGYDEAMAVTVDSQGNVYVTGESIGGFGTRDITTIKYVPVGGSP